MNRKILEKYAEAKAIIAQQEAVIELYKEEVLKEIQGVVGDQEKVNVNLEGYGKFWIETRKDWKYSKKIAEIEENLKAEKLHEQQTSAEFTEKPIVKFSAIKND